MARPPKARDAALRAARHIVRTRGAAHLTFDAIAAEGGVTKGGVLYHFPSKVRLLETLLEADLRALDAADDSNITDVARAFEGAIRSSLGARPPGVGDLVAGLLGASAEHSALLRIVREREERRFAQWIWDDAGIMRYLLLLAAEGAERRRYYALFPTLDSVEKRLAELVESLLANT